LEETIFLIRMVEDHVGEQILSQEVSSLTTSKSKEYKFKSRSKTFQPDSIMVRKSNKEVQVQLSKYIDYSTAKSINYQKIPWTEIAQKLKTRSKDDCRNRWYLQVYNSLFQKSTYSAKDERRLLRKVKKQGKEVETEINWKLIHNGKSVSENRWKWSRMKKIVAGRRCFTLDDLIDKLEQYYSDGRIEKSEKLKMDEEEPTKQVGRKKNELLEMWINEYDGY
jgi:hypothetical protein